MVSDPAIHPSLQPERELPELVVPGGMVRDEFRAMGTSITILLPEFEASNALLVRELFEEWEQALSRFLPESELSWLNEHPGEQVIVSKLLYSVLTASLAAAEATRGVYDPTMLDQLMQLGYDRSFDKLPGSLAASAYEGYPGGGWRNIRVNEMLRSVMLPAGIKLDFGGIAKGMAVDAALERLRHAGVSSALVNAGGDLATLGLPLFADHWAVALPIKDTCWTIPLHHGAIATSGIARRHWSQGQAARHHLLNPLTGLPADSGMWSVTTVAARCEQAEVGAKTAFVLGMEQGKAFLREQQLAGLLVDAEGHWDTVGSWPRKLMIKVGAYE